MKSILAFFKNKEEQLLEAIKQHDLNEVKRLLIQQLNINYTDIENRRTALHWAIWLGYHDIVNLLAPRYQNFATIDKTGKIPLHLAVIKNDLESVKILQKHDSDFLVNILTPDNEGKTSQYVAMEQHLLEISTLFVNYVLPMLDKPIVIKTDRYGLVEASEVDPGVYIFIEELVLLEKKFGKMSEGIGYSKKQDVSKLNAFKSHIFPKAKSSEILSVLSQENTIEFPTDHSSSSEKLTQDLLTSAINGDITLVRKYLTLGADINGRIDFFGQTALHLATENHNKEVVRFLLDRGADTSLKDINGHTALDLAKPDILPLFSQVREFQQRLPQRKRINLTTFSEKQHKEEKDPQKLTEKLLAAAKRGDVDSVYNYVKQGGDMNGRDREGKTALHLAAENADDVLVRYLVVHGADTTLQDKKGYTAVDLADPNISLQISQIKKYQQNKKNSTLKSEKETEFSTLKPPSYTSKNVLFKAQTTTESLENLDIETLDKMIIDLEDRLKTLKEIKSAKEAVVLTTASNYKRQ